MTTTRQPFRAAVVGTAFSDVRRRAEKSMGAFAVEAAHKAVADSGLDLHDIDGLAVYPSASRLSPGDVDGVDIVGAGHMARALGLKDLRWVCDQNPGSMLGSFIEAVNAVVAGLCECVLVWRAMYHPPAGRGQYNVTHTPVASGMREFSAPFGITHPVLTFALPYSEYMARYGARREHMATRIVNNRRNANLNPEAIWYGQFRTT
jgi:acetyl-CoA acetyltransferase